MQNKTTLQYMKDHHLYKLITSLDLDRHILSERYKYQSKD